MANRNDPDPAAAAIPSQPAPPPIDPTAIQTAPPSVPADGIQSEVPPPAPDRISLPPLSPEQRIAVDTERRERISVRLDLLLVVSVLGLAFLSALFPIRNSDFLMHLGTGKLFSQGKYTLGEDPFSVNSQDARWVNHSWLLDAASYPLYLATGAKGLTILKALVATALAAILLMIRRPGQSLWIPALCTGLAILTLSPRLLMQPAVLSFLFLAVTLWVLTLPGTTLVRKAGANEEPSPLARFAAWPYRLYILPVLFAVWVNVDAWFILGPITVALYWLGETLQETLAPVPNGPDSPKPGERRRLLLVLLIGLAACLLNPYHVHAFQVPGELPAAVGKEIQEDPLFRRMFAQPFGGDYFTRANLQYSIAGMAFYPLLVLSLASFAFNLAGWRWWRALIWSAFAALAAYHVRSVPFFAVVAGPIMALNFQDMMLRRLAERRAAPMAPSLWPLAGRVLSLLVLVIAVAAAWAGWLHGSPGDLAADTRRVGWGIELDPALVDTAEHLAQWRRDGKIEGEMCAFNFHPDVAYYFAFYCPEVKSSFDYRFPLYKDTASTYLKTRDALNPARAMEDFRPRTTLSRGGSGADWQRTFREQHITHVIVYDPDPRRMMSVIQGMEEDKSQPESQRQWTLIDVRGRVAVYAWSDPEKGRDATVRAMELQPDQQAFGRHAETAPGKRPDKGPQTRDNLWTQYSTPFHARTADSHEAWFHYYISQLETTQAQRVAGGEYARQIASVICLGASPRAMPERASYFLGPYYSALSGPPGKFRSPASTLLAIRAARRALAENPDDDVAYSLLALSYEGLPESESPLDLYSPRSMLADIRRCQITGSLVNALKLRPDRAELHKELALVYLHEEFHDLSLKHWKEYLRLTEDAGPYPGEREDVYRDRLNRLRDDVKALDEQVKQAQNQFLTATQGSTMQVLSKVQLAQRRNLMGQALDLLLAADPIDLGSLGEFMELQLLLRVGRVEEWPAQLRDIEPQDPRSWLLVLRAATIGDYDQADEMLAKLVPVARQRHLAPLPLVVSQLLSVNWLDLVDPTGMKPLVWQINQRLNLSQIQALRRMALISVDEGELSIIRGLLALEAGKIGLASEQFHHALTISAPPGRYVPYFAVLGTNSPLEAALSYGASTELAVGTYQLFPSQRWAIEYTKLLDRAAK